MLTLGQQGEAFAAEQLQRRQWQILARNYRGRGFELDIVAIKQQSLVVFEVKTRSKYLAEARSGVLTPQKCRSLEHGLQHFISQKINLPEWQTIRIDLILVEAKGKSWRLEVFPSAHQIGGP